VDEHSQQEKQAAWYWFPTSAHRNILEVGSVFSHLAFDLPITAPNRPTLDGKFAFLAFGKVQLGIAVLAKGLTVLLDRFT
jgi:hypothetical protein